MSKPTYGARRDAPSSGRLPEVRLKVRATGRHPWFYRKMIQKPKEQLPAGSAVKVRDRDGRFVGSGFYNPRAELALRMFSDGEVRGLAEHFIDALDRAIRLREEILQVTRVTDAYRLVHAEADGFPGLIIDKLGDAVVAQVASLGMQQQLEPVGESLMRHYPKARLVLLQDKDWAEREGMERLPRPRPVQTTVREHGIRYQVQAGTGHKTGFFADQRDNRLTVRMLARNRDVLGLCCNSGGFAMNAVKGGAVRVLAGDLDEAMVAQTEANARANDLALDVVHADAFDMLRDAKPGRHDLIVLDPPKWVANKNELDQGLERYADLNRLGLEKVARGGGVVTCSCSGSVSEERFVRMLRDAAAAARRDVRVTALRSAGGDHPFALECPETRYLKVAFLQVR
ncbi:MAG: class I SAM-dependent rRNA methyltransferase [Planctomycetota bacterium]|nr:class I SAM-dependent rRNA methyltransferase [Planctomycetota bacterium]